MQIPDFSKKLVVRGGLLLLLSYALWIGGPYLRSVVVRDAAVSTWIHVAAAPIDGVIANPLRMGERVGADGRIFTVDNPRADAVALARVRGDLDQARIRAASLTRVVRVLEALASARRTGAAEYAENFKHNLDVKIAGMTDYVRVSQRRLTLERAEASRVSRLLTAGLATQSAVDAVTSRVADVERAIVDTQTGLDRAMLHRRAAEHGQFLLDDGSDGAAMQRSFEDARVALDRIRSELAVAQKDAETAQLVLDNARRLFDRQKSADAVALPGAIVWSPVVAAGSAVRQGSPVASWIDCRIILVDAAVSDVELSLLRKGAPADVVLDGERRSRRGSVLLIRGGAATLGSADLAAVAKGRRPGVGQVLIELDATAADVEACPVGRAAFVHFPEVTVLDIARARLRW
jgi:multidrug resistance efflux pump